MKPSNFLFSIEANTGVLVDFGLAQKDPRTRQQPEFKKPLPGGKVEKLKLKPRAGIIQNETRLNLRAERAGTRGFRAPEVLFRVTAQTCAIDIWSAGAILLCIAGNQYPFFISNTDAEALIEISLLFGITEFQKLAKKLGKN